MHELKLQDDGFDWLLERIQVLEGKFKTEPAKFELEFIMMITQLKKDMESANYTADPKPPRKKRAPNGSQATAPKRDECTEHPTYGAIRVPRTDCQGCWAMYKTYNPLKFDKAWRDFQRKSAATTNTE